VYGVVTMRNAGGSIIPDTSHKNRLHFTGYELDPDTGLYLARNRWYNPRLARFMQPDPIGLAGGDLNLYRYCGNNPVNRTDPMGFTNAPGDFGWDNYREPTSSRDNAVSYTSPTTYRIQGGLYAVSGLALGAASVLGAPESAGTTLLAFPTAGLFLTSGLAQLITGEPGLDPLGIILDPRYSFLDPSAYPRMENRRTKDPCSDVEKEKKP
jgi:RHS repeat-associated protein